MIVFDDSLGEVAEKCNSRLVQNVTLYLLLRIDVP